MWIKAGGESGTRFSNLALWATVGLGVTIGLYSSRKRIKCFNRMLGVLAREENDNGIERLPDDILGDIVSRLKPYEARRTSILSKRWRKIWTLKGSFMASCHATIDPGIHYAYVDRLRFLKVVDQSLDLYSGRKLKLFHVHCCFLNRHECHLVRWMQSLTRLHVEEIYLGHSCSTCNGESLDKAFTFSCKLIHGLNMLKCLDLTSCYVETSFISQCNSLERLNLRGMRLASHELPDILMSCPNLTRLCLERCELPLNLRISGPNLKLDFFRLDDCYNVQKLEISDVSIVTLAIHIYNEVEISLSSLPKLIRLHLRTPRTRCNFKDNAARDDLPLLKYLLIQTTYQILQLPSRFQVFGNVRILSLFAKDCPCGETSEEVDLWNFAPVLVAAPFLEEFYLAVGGPVCDTIREETEWPVLQHKCLTYMELSGFTYTQNELEFAKFIARNTLVLQTLRLWRYVRTFKARKFCVESGKPFQQMYTKEEVMAYLEGHFISSHAILDL